jgi:hypothetical protein
MNPEILQQMQSDIEFVKNLSDINTPEEMRSMVNKMLGYLDLIDQTRAEYEYKATQLKGKKEVLKGYIQNLKQQATEASISRSQVNK